MSRIFKANARIKHHTITGTGITFSIPSNDDFTITATSSTGLLWTKTDLLPSEFGINNDDKTLSIRVNDEVKTIGLWSNPISMSFSVGGSGNYNIVTIPVTQKDMNNNWNVSLYEFKYSLNSFGDSTNTKDYYVGNYQMSWKPNGGSYSFNSTATWSGTKMATGEFNTYFSYGFTASDNSYGATLSLYISQSGGTIRGVNSKVMWKKTIL
jgi:hypothetical protein